MGGEIYIPARLIPYSDTLAGWTATNPIIKESEIVIEVGSPMKAKVGDGTSHYLSLPYLGSGGGGGGGNLQATLNAGNTASDIAGGANSIDLIYSSGTSHTFTSPSGYFVLKGSGSTELASLYREFPGGAGKLLLNDGVGGSGNSRLMNEAGFTGDIDFTFRKDAVSGGLVTENGVHEIVVSNLTDTNTSNQENLQFSLWRGATLLGAFLNDVATHTPRLKMISQGGGFYATLLSNPNFTNNRTHNLPNADGVLSPATDVNGFGSYYGTGNLSAIGNGIFLSLTGQLECYISGVLRAILEGDQLLFKDQTSGFFGGFLMNLGSLSAGRTWNLPDDNGWIPMANDVSTQGSLYGTGTVAAPTSGVLIDKANGEIKIYGSSSLVLRLSAVGAGGFITIKDATTGFSSSINVNPLTANRTHSLPNVNGELSVNSGGSSSQVLAGATTMTVNHGYGYTPSRVFIQYISTRPAGANNEIVNNITGTTFDIVFPTPVTGTVGINHQGFK